MNRSNVRLLRISDVAPLDGFRLSLTLTDGSAIERDIAPLLDGPVFDLVRDSDEHFRSVRVEHGTIVWPNGADLCPDVLILGGPPRDGTVPDRVVFATDIRPLHSAVSE